MTARFGNVNTGKSTDFKLIKALVVLYKHIKALIERPCAYKKWVYPLGSRLTEWSAFYSLIFSKKMQTRVQIRTGAWPGRLGKCLEHCHDDLLTSYTTGSVGLMDDGYQFDTDSCVPRMQITSRMSLPSDCWHPGKKRVGLPLAVPF